MNSDNSSEVICCGVCLQWRFDWNIFSPPPPPRRSPGNYTAV